MTKNLGEWRPGMEETVKKNLATYTTALTLLAALAVPVQLAAQGNQENINRKHHHYKLIDLGTFGGPQSYLTNSEFTSEADVDNRGVLTGWADTTAPDPYPNFCFWDCFIVRAFQWKNGVKSDLGVLPGGASSQPSWISASGLIAGWSQNGEIDPLVAGFPENRAVLWKEGNIHDLGVLSEGGYESLGIAVNSKGLVVGLASNTTPDPYSMLGLGYQARAFVWDEQNGMQDLGTLGGTDAQALLVNDRGEVVGWSYNSSAQSALCASFGLGLSLTTGSFIWDKKNGMVNLGGIGNTCTLAQGLNNRGQVVGESFLNNDQAGPAFLWERTKGFHVLPTLGGNFADAYSINEKEEAVGGSYLKGNVQIDAALWETDGVTDLGTLNGDTCAFGFWINASEQAVGVSNCFSDSTRGFLWEDGRMADLNALIVPDSDFQIPAAFTINDHGEIAAKGVLPDQDEHAILLIPCDENHPGIDGCDYSLVDVAEAARHISASATHNPTFVPPAVLATSLTRPTRIKTGTTTPTSADTVKVLPTITSFTPVSGLVGISVTITGTGLKQTTKVTFGGMPATFVAKSNTLVTATVPSGAVTGKIDVTTPAGSAVSSAIFTVGNSSVLDGYCVSGGLSCSATYNPTECRIGATPIDPGSVQCGFPSYPKVNVDFGRSCDAGGGYCGRTGSSRRP